MQVDVLVSKLKSRFNVEAELKPVRVPYREKIRKTVQKQGRHKKQTGGSGQFGDVWIRFEPQTEQEDMIFAEEVFGGSVPKNFFPAVEKGLREACAHGPLAGYPVVNLKAVLYDGSYHPVDSSEIAFKTAAQLAYKAALPEANPVLLEPVGELKVTVPDSYMGDVIGDLNKRRGRVMGMDPTGDGNQVISAEVPMAEMGSYAIDLRSMTQSRGSFTFHFVRYEDCPPAAQEKAIAEAKALWRRRSDPVPSGSPTRDPGADAGPRGKKPGQRSGDASFPARKAERSGFRPASPAHVPRKRPLLRRSALAVEGRDPVAIRAVRSRTPGAGRRIRSWEKAHGQMKRREAVPARNSGTERISRPAQCLAHGSGKVMAGSKAWT